MQGLKSSQRENGAQITELTERLALMQKILTRRLAVSNFDMDSLRHQVETWIRPKESDLPGSYH
uniref:Uncharacterized protein n=1 Tax=Bionectria ochroleuca TaxID=29856 RepID=A0A0B7KJ69_BIOOC